MQLSFINKANFLFRLTVMFLEYCTYKFHRNAVKLMPLLCSVKLLSKYSFLLCKLELFHDFEMKTYQGREHLPLIWACQIFKIKKPIHTKLYVMTVVISLLHRLIILERTSSRGAIVSLNIHKYLHQMNFYPYIQIDLSS